MHQHEVQNNYGQDQPKCLEDPDRNLFHNVLLLPKCSYSSTHISAHESMKPQMLSGEFCSDFCIRVYQTWFDR